MRTQSSWIPQTFWLWWLERQWPSHVLLQAPSNQHSCLVQVFPVAHRTSSVWTSLPSQQLRVESTRARLGPPPQPSPLMSWVGRTPLLHNYHSLFLSSAFFQRNSYVTLATIQPEKQLCYPSNHSTRETVHNRTNCSPWNKLPSTDNYPYYGSSDKPWSPQGNIICILQLWHHFVGLDMRLTNYVAWHGIINIR